MVVHWDQHKFVDHDASVAIMFAGNTVRGAAVTRTDGMGVSPHMSTSSTPASKVPDVKFAASINQLLIKLIVNSLHHRAPFKMLLMHTLECNAALHVIWCCNTHA